MFTAVFWNIEQKSPRDGIVRLITALQRQEGADVLALAECPGGVIGSLLRALNPSGQANFRALPLTSRVRVLVRATVTHAAEVERHPYYSVITMERPTSANLLLVAVHMVSLREKDAPHIDKELELMADAIRGIERTLNCDRTILIGDLNAHPFSDGVASSVGLHGVMSRRVAGEGGRQAAHRYYPYFFNPMWRFFGDATTEPPGTYYREAGGDHTAFYWHLFDQVLIRPSLLPSYRDDSACIVTSVEGTALGNADYQPDRATGSDHYPVRIRLHD